MGAAKKNPRIGTGTLMMGSGDEPVSMISAWSVVVARVSHEYTQASSMTRKRLREFLAASSATLRLSKSLMSSGSLAEVTSAPASWPAVRAGDPLESGVRQVGSLEITVGHVRVQENRLVEVGPLQVSPAEVGPPQV